MARKANPLNMKKILVFTDWFEPGYRAGGPIRSCVNFVTNMQDDYEVFVFTSDRDLGSSAPYPEISVNTWIPFGRKAKVFYSAPQEQGIIAVRNQISMIRPDYLYLNSMFSKQFTIFPLLIMKIANVPCKVILAPRGMLRESAVSFKPYKKKVFLLLCKSFGLQTKTNFHATDEIEKQDIHKYFGNDAKVVVIPNFPGRIDDKPVPVKKNRGGLKVIFVGRIHPIKNLDYLLNVLKEINEPVSLSIAGSEEDKNYLAYCKTLIEQLPGFIKVIFLGELPPAELPSVMAEHHIFALPTKGENFGHAIFEALVAGKPVLISDQTPWRNLQSVKAGWDISLERPDLFSASVKQAISFDQQEYNTWCEGAWKYVNDYVKGSDLKKAYQNLFN